MATAERGDWSVRPDINATTARDLRDATSCRPSPNRCAPASSQRQVARSGLLERSGRTRVGKADVGLPLSTESGRRPSNRAARSRQQRALRAASAVGRRAGARRRLAGVEGVRLIGRPYNKRLMLSVLESSSIRTVPDGRGGHLCPRAAGTAPAESLRLGPASQAPACAHGHCAAVPAAHALRPVR